MWKINATFKSRVLTADFCAKETQSQLNTLSLLFRLSSIYENCTLPLTVLPLPSLIFFWFMLIVMELNPDIFDKCVESNLLTQNASIILGKVGILQGSEFTPPKRQSYLK